MWVTKSLLGLFDISKQTVDELRIDLAVARSERDILRTQLTAANTNIDWLRTKVNALEMERHGLIERAYQIKLPSVPELVRTPIEFDPTVFHQNHFDDVGNELARQLGYPTETE